MKINITRIVKELLLTIETSMKKRRRSLSTKNFQKYISKKLQRVNLNDLFFISDPSSLYLSAMSLMEPIGPKNESRFGFAKNRMMKMLIDLMEKSWELKIQIN